MKTKKLAVMAGAMAMVFSMCSCGTEWLAALGQGMNSMSMAMFGGGSTNSYVSGNASTMMVDGGVPYGSVYVPGDLSIYKNSIVDPYPLGATYDSGTSTSTTTTTTTRTTGTCTACNGTGSYKRTVSVATYGVDNKETRCSTCGEWMKAGSHHTHVTCSTCGGTGRH